MYNILLDKNKYYTGMACFAKYSRFEGGIDMDSLPPNEYKEDGEIDLLKMQSYKLVDGIWEYDENHYNELLLAEQEKANEPTEATAEEQIATLQGQVDMLTECVLEMSTMLYA